MRVSRFYVILSVFPKTRCASMISSNEVTLETAARLQLAQLGNSVTFRCWGQFCFPGNLTPVTSITFQKNVKLVCESQRKIGEFYLLGSARNLFRWYPFPLSHLTATKFETAPLSNSFFSQRRSSSSEHQNKLGSCHKRQKAQAPTPRAPIRNRQTRKVANAKILNRNTNLT